MNSISKRIRNVLSIPLKREQKKNFTIAVITGFVYSAMLVGTPFLVSVILYSSEKGSILGIRFSFGILTVILLVYCIITMFLYLLNRTAINDFIFSVKLYIEEKTVRYILQHEKSASKTTNVINNDIPSLCNLYYSNIFKVLNSAFFIICGLIYSAVVSVWAIAIEVVFLLIAVSIQLFFRKSIASNYDHYRRHKQDAIRGISSFINGKLTIQSNDAYSYAESTVGNLISDKAESEYSFQIHKRTSNILICTVPAMATIISSLLLSLLISEGELEKKAALAVAYVVGYMVWEMIKMVPILNHFATVKSIREYINLVTGTCETEEEQASVSVTSVHYISLTDITVRTPKKTILHDVCMDLNMQGKYLVVGNSGSGKTTLLHAIMGTVNYSGRISDGTASNGIFRNLINYLPQSVEVFPGTVSSNIAICDQFLEANIMSALKRSNYEKLNAEETIDPFSESFSGGELKKIAFARALFHQDRKPIMLLDEPFEGLDQESRSVIEREILAHNGLTVVTSHILDADFAAQVDNIIVIEDGVVAYMGHFDDIPYALKQHYFGQTGT